MQHICVIAATTSTKATTDAVLSVGDGLLRILYYILMYKVKCAPRLLNNFRLSWHQMTANAIEGQRMRAPNKSVETIP